MKYTNSIKKPINNCFYYEKSKTNHSILFALKLYYFPADKILNFRKFNNEMIDRYFILNS